MLRFTLALMLVATLAVSPSHAQRWSIFPADTISLAANGFTPGSMSGVAYTGSPGGVSGGHRFVAAQDDGSGGIEFTLVLNASGEVQSATATDAFPFSPGLDDEAIALTAAPGIALVSEEGTSSIRHIVLGNGNVISSISTPTVYSNIRPNRGLESLATWGLNLNGFRMATANEEALTIDGPASTTTDGTVVRVQTFDMVGGASGPFTPTVTKQFAYEVDPIHAGSSTNGDTRSGLSELIAMPDKTLVALERSLASSLAPPPFQNRLYEIDFSEATDTSATTFDAGLVGATYTPANKELLWVGVVGGSFGENLEGLTVGPQLANGNWLLVGVVDNGDPISGNTIVTFEAAPIVSADFNDSSKVDGGDFLMWQREAGEGQFLSDAFDADGNRDGNVNGDDRALWQTSFGNAAVVSSDTIPEPSSLCLALLATACLAQRRRRIHLLALHDDMWMTESFE